MRYERNQPRSGRQSPDYNRNYGVSDYPEYNYSEYRSSENQDRERRGPVRGRQQNPWRREDYQDEFSRDREMSRGYGMSDRYNDRDTYGRYPYNQTDESNYNRNHFSRMEDDNSYSSMGYEDRGNSPGWSRGENDNDRSRWEQSSYRSQSGRGNRNFGNQDPGYIGSYDRSAWYDPSYNTLSGGSYQYGEGSSSYGNSGSRGRNYGETSYAGGMNPSQGSSYNASSFDTVGSQGYGSGPAQSWRGEHYGQSPKNYKRTDDRIREDICDRLTALGDVDKSDIDVKVKDGEVTLSGTVTDRSAKNRIEDVCETALGVTDVQNNLRVKSGKSSSSSMTGSSSSSSKTGNDSQESETRSTKRLSSVS